MTARSKICDEPSPKLAEPNKWSPEFNEFIALCLNKNPENRPDAIQLLTHPFVLKCADNRAIKELISSCFIKNEKQTSKTKPVIRIDKKKLKEMQEEKLRQEKLDMLLNLADKGNIDESFSFKVQMPYFLDPINEKKPQNTIIIPNQTENCTIIPSAEQTDTTNQQTDTTNQQIDPTNQQTDLTNQQTDTTNQQINTTANQQNKQIDKLNQCNIS